MGSGVLRVGAVVVGFLSLAVARESPHENTTEDLRSLMKRTEQGRPCDYKPNMTISSSEDFDGLRTCDTLNGSLTILWTDDVKPTLQLYSLTSITGDVIFKDQRNDPQDAISISADSLVTVEGSLTFAGMPKMSMPSFGSLVSVSTIAFQDVTFNESSTFGAATFGSLHLAQAISFNNTNVVDVGGNWTGPFGLPVGSQTDTFTFVAVDNPNLQSIMIPGFDQVDTNITIEHNAEELSVDFPNIARCMLNLQGVSSFTAAQLQQIGLADATGSGNSSDTPGPKLSTRQTGKDSTVSDNLISNNNFDALELQALIAIVGTVEISNNPALKTISFPELAVINGELKITGDSFDSIDVDPNVTFEDGGQLMVQAPNAKALCQTSNLDGANIVCQPVSQQVAPGQNGDGANGANSDGSSNSNNPTAPTPTPPPGSSNNGLSPGAKAGIGVGVALAVLLLTVLAFILYRRRSRRSPSSSSSSSRSPDPYGRKDLPSTSEATTTTSPLSPQRYSKVPSEMRTEELAPQRPVSGVSFDDERGNGVGGIGGGGISDRPPRISDDRGYGSGKTHSRRGLSNERALELEEQQGERFEMEEQQGMRHEMDARSLPDIDLDDDDVERRSLEDIERARNSGPTAGGGLGHGHGPVSPVG